MKIEERKTYPIALGLCILLLLPFLYLSFFCYPVADDLTYAWKGQNKEFWKAITNEYQFWNGRYFSNILVLHNPFGYGSLLLYRLVPIALIIGIILSAKHYFQSLFKNAFTSRSYWIWAILFCLIFLCTMPDISEGIYWYTGSVSYTLGCIFLLFSFSFKLQKRTLLSLLFLFLGMGCSEVCMLFGLLIIGTKHFLFNQRNWILLIATIFFSALVYFAPGNEIRSSLFEAKHQFLHSLLYSIAQTARFNFAFLGITIFLASTLWIYSLEYLNERSLTIRNSFGLNWKNSWLLLLIPIFISTFPAYWSTGILGQHRTTNVACFFWIFAWLANITVWYNLLKSKSFFKKYLFAALLLLFTIPNFFVRNDHLHLLTDLLESRHKVYSNIMQERWLRMNNCSELEPGSIIYLPKDSSECYTLDVLPLYEPKHWMNEGYALFSNCDDILIEKE